MVKSSDLVAKIETLERQSTALDPGKEKRKELMALAQNYSEEFLARIEDRAYNANDTSKTIGDYPIEETGESPDRLLRIFEEAVEKPGINPASGGHLGYIPGGGLFPSAIGDFLAAVTNRYAGIYFGNPGAVRMEQMMVDWLCSIVPYPDSAGGTLCSGGSIANLIGITAARDFYKIEGSAVEKAVIYLTEQAHHSLPKALRIAGLGKCHLRRIRLESDFKMSAEDLESKILEDKESGFKPFLVLTSAGTTDTGVVDPLSDVSDICEKHDLWHHIDAAYGGCFALVDQLKPLFKGWERAQSITIDPHKGLFLPYGTGALLIRQPELLLESHQYLANYMRDAQAGDQIHSPADLSPELTRHFRGLRMWFPLKLFGVKPFRAALEEKHLLARYFHQKIQDLGFEAGPEPELSVVIYRYTKGLNKPEYNAFNQSLVKKCHLDGRVFLSSTVINEEVWMRLAVLSFRTHLSTIQKTLEMLREKVDELLETGIE